MRFLVNHGEKLVCGAIVALCCAWVYGSLQSELSERPDFGLVCPSRRDPPTGDVSTYRYHSSQLTPYAKRLREHLTRSEEPVTCAYASRAWYPCPDRPEVIFVGRRDRRRPAWTVGGFPVFAGLRAEGRHGYVVLTCCRPERNRRFVPVRLEVQRAPSPDAFKWTVHRFELDRE